MPFTDANNRRFELIQKYFEKIPEEQLGLSCDEFEKLASIMANELPEVILERIDEVKKCGCKRDKSPAPHAKRECQKKPDWKTPMRRVIDDIKGRQLHLDLVPPPSDESETSADGGCPMIKQEKHDCHTPLRRPEALIRKRRLPLHMSPPSSEHLPPVNLPPPRIKVEPCSTREPVTPFNAEGRDTVQRLRVPASRIPKRVRGKNPQKAVAPNKCPVHGVQAARKHVPDRYQNECVNMAKSKIPVLKNKHKHPHVCGGAKPKIPNKPPCMRSDKRRNLPPFPAPIRNDENYANLPCQPPKFNPNLFPISNRLAKRFDDHQFENNCNVRRPVKANGLRPPRPTMIGPDCEQPRKQKEHKCRRQ